MKIKIFIWLYGLLSSFVQISESFLFGNINIFSSNVSRLFIEWDFYRDTCCLRSIDEGFSY